MNRWCHDSVLQDVKIKFFFCKTSKRGKWNCLPTTNCELKFEEAYEIYATLGALFRQAKATTLEITVKTYLDGYH
jgi:hypothetical protein